MTDEEKRNLVIEYGTRDFFDYIMSELSKKSEMVVYDYHIPFAYDKERLRKMLAEAGVIMEETSSYYTEKDKFVPFYYMPLDRIVFKRGKAEDKANRRIKEIK